MRSALKLAIVASVAAALTTSVAGPAFGDPPSGVTPAAKDIVGVGSDTTEFFVDQIALNFDGKTPPPGRKFYSWDATGSSPITTKTGATSIPRPDGSSAGIGALVNNTSATVDFARSSRGRGGSDPANINFVAFAKDAVTVATETTTNSIGGLTTAQLQAIFTCSATTWKDIGGKSNATIEPFLPQSGSGTRNFFEAAIGITDAQVGACVTQGVQENEGTDSRLKNNPNAIVPYSVAKFIAQVYHSGAGGNDFGTDVHGTYKLHNLNGTSPTTGTAPNVKINPNFSATFQRFVYNVVRKDNTTSDTIPAYLDYMFRHGGYLCGQTDTIKDYGFLPIGQQCGTVS